jgi:predicted nucleotidyltransferase component of viral defense system
MRLSFLELPGHERRLYFEQAAARRGLSAVVLEKDFWVCWLLGVLFRSEFRDRLVFKRGTSLSNPPRRHPLSHRHRRKGS